MPTMSSLSMNIKPKFQHHRGWAEGIDVLNLCGSGQGSFGISIIIQQIAAFENEFKLFQSQTQCRVYKECGIISIELTLVEIMFSKNRDTKPLREESCYQRLVEGGHLR